MEIKVGQQVFLKLINNGARRNNKEIREEIVMKVGRKYFFTGKENENERFWTKFSIEDLIEATEYSPGWEVYFSMQEILDNEESNKLIREIRNKFNTYGKVNLSLDQIRRIKEIISE